MGSSGRSLIVKRRPINETMKVLVAVFVGSVLGFFIGISSPKLSLTKFNITSCLISEISNVENKLSSQISGDASPSSPIESENNSSTSQNTSDPLKIWVPTNPRGSETLPAGIVTAESDLFPRKLSGRPSEDIIHQPRYLVTFTVGYNQKNNIDEAVKKFSDNFTILLFHYDGKTNEWDEFEWSKRAIHISVPKQGKWWYAKRFLHPSIVAPYEYIFIWDEDLGVEHFNAEEYIKLAKKHGLEISQPGLEQAGALTWQLTKRREDSEVHKETIEKPGWCSDPHLPPCAAFVEIMAPVFTRDAWRCVWHMLQNDLVHGWGIDFGLQKCAQPAHEKIGVVDAQWIFHKSVRSLGDKAESETIEAAWRRVRERSKIEWSIFLRRLRKAENAYYSEKGIDPSQFTKPCSGCKVWH